MAIVRVDAYKTLAYSGISGTYAAVGSPVAHNWRAFRIQNATDGDMIISFDGTTDNLFMPAGSFVLYDVATNATPIGTIDNLLVGINTQFYVKQSTPPSKGAIYIEGIYAKGQ